MGIIGLIDSVTQSTQSTVEKLNRFEDLGCWQQARDLVSGDYASCKNNITYGRCWTLLFCWIGEGGRRADLPAEADAGLSEACP